MLAFTSTDRGLTQLIARKVMLRFVLAFSETLPLQVV
jgi:hypothetical protein